LRTLLLCLIGVPVAAFSAASGADGSRRTAPSAGGRYRNRSRAKVCGSQPSRMLRDRLLAAADYLEANPASNCVVSGGQGATKHKARLR